MIWRMWYIIPRTLYIIDLSDKYTCKYCRGKTCIVGTDNYVSEPFSDLQITNILNRSFGRRVRGICPVCEGYGYVDWVTNIRYHEEHPNADLRRWPLEYMYDFFTVFYVCLKIWKNRIKYRLTGKKDKHFK